MSDGVVRWFDEDKGYGFITGQDGSNIFVHYSNILMNGFKELKEGEKVRYDVDISGKGKSAINVYRIDD